MSKTNKELAAELTIAMLNHNAQLHVGAIPNSSEGASKAPVMNGKAVADNFTYILHAIQQEKD